MFRKAGGDDLRDVDRGIHANPVVQISRAHRPAEPLPRRIDREKIGAVGAQLSERLHVRSANSIDAKPRAILDADWRLSHRATVAHDFSDRSFSASGAANHFDPPP